MRAHPRNAILILTATLLIGLSFITVREDAAGRAPAPTPRRHALTGTIKLKGDPPDIDALNKRLLEMMRARDTEYCLKCDDSEKTQQSYRLGGKDNRQVGNVFVWLVPDTGSFFPVSDKQLEEAKKREVVLHQPHCAFIPHCQFLFSRYRPEPRSKYKPTGQTWAVRNDAQIGHNVNYKGEKNAGDNITLAAGGSTRSVTNLVPETSPLVISCNIHPWMRAYVRVVDTPYYAISLSDTLDGGDRVKKEDAKFGTYEIKDPPAGKVRILAWHEEAGYLNKEDYRGEPIELKATGTTRKDFELSVPKGRR